MEDAMALDEMDYGSDFEDWKIYENKVATMWFAEKEISRRP